jgi:hypothetical protein
MAAGRLCRRRAPVLGDCVQRLSFRSCRDRKNDCESTRSGTDSSSLHVSRHPPPPNTLAALGGASTTASV